MINRFICPLLGLLMTALAGPLRADDAPRIGVLLKGTSAFWSAVGEGARAVAEGNGAEALVRMPETESDIDVQIAMVGELVEAGIDALVIAPSSSVELSGAVEAAAAAGVRIVVIDTAISGEMPV